MATKKLAFWMKKEKKPTAGSWNFKKLSGWVAKEYIAKGKSPAEAKKIGAAVAAKIWVAKFGQKAMTKAAVKGKKIKK